MCGTYAFRKAPREVRALLREHWRPIDIPDDLWMPSYKIKPSQFAPAIVGYDAPSVEMLRWGLLPHWMRERGKAQINAKSETAAEKPMFRASMRHSRCIILADGFYEPKGQKQPRPWHFFQRESEELLGFAGIFTHSAPGTASSAGFAILTTSPNADVAPVHERMPVILRMGDWNDWLNLSVPVPTLESLYNPDVAPRLQSWPVPDDAKKSSFPDGPNCIEDLRPNR